MEEVRRKGEEEEGEKQRSEGREEDVTRKKGQKREPPERGVLREREGGG